MNVKEDEFIIKNSKRMTCVEMGSHLGCSEKTVRKRIKQLKLERPGYVRNGEFHLLYTKKEDELIKKFYPTKSIEFLKTKLKHRSEQSIRSRARRFEVKKEASKASPYLNRGKVSMLLRVAPQTVTNWIRQGYLKASAGRRTGLSREWKVEKQDFYDFVKKCYFLFDAERVKDSFLRSIIESTPASKAVSVRQAAEVLGISKSQVRRRIYKGTLRAYKNFGGHKGLWGKFRFLVVLDNPDEWFQGLGSSSDNRVANWLVETARLQDSNSIKLLNVAIECTPEKIKKVYKSIKANSPRAYAFLEEFEKTQKGERLRQLIENPRF